MMQERTLSPTRDGRVRKGWLWEGCEKASIKNRQTPGRGLTSEKKETIDFSAAV